MPPAWPTPFAPKACAGAVWLEMEPLLAWQPPAAPVSAGICGRLHELDWKLTGERLGCLDERFEYCKDSNSCKKDSSA